MVDRWLGPGAWPDLASPQITLLSPMLSLQTSIKPFAHPRCTRPCHPALQEFKVGQAPGLHPVEMAARIAKFQVAQLSPSPQAYPRPS